MIAMHHPGQRLHIGEGMVTYIKAYIGVLLGFFAIDIFWITWVVKPLYDREVPGMLRAEPLVGAAVVFYLLYVAGVVFFAVVPALRSGGIKVALLNGAIYGGLAYATYAFTNYSVLEGWTLTLVVSDVAWGVVLSAFTAACGLLAARLLTVSRFRHILKT